MSCDVADGGGGSCHSVISQTTKDGVIEWIEFTDAEEAMLYQNATEQAAVYFRQAKEHSSSFFPSDDLSLDESDTDEAESPEMPSPTTSRPTSSTFNSPQSQSRNVADCLSDKRGINLQLPSFTGLGISSQSHDSEDGGKQNDLLKPAIVSQATVRTTLTASLDSRAQSYRCAPSLLTPPPDDIDSTKWHNDIFRTSAGMITHSASHPETTSQQNALVQTNSTQRLPGIDLSNALGMTSLSQIQGLPWVTRATRSIVSFLNQASPTHQVQIVSQTLPCQAKDGRVKPTFEEVLELVQMEMSTEPYVTLTHAVPPVRVMEEIPKTPPSTPGARREVNDYFGGDQTIFTHAAVVPIYHNYNRSSAESETRVAHRIAAPGSVQVSILERYVPPTMPAEIDDFFGMSPRSYLVDRLSELSTNNGSLLLVYPTRNGGGTFARKYVSPVLDPYLRQFILLNNLTSDAAAAMGRMTAVDGMIDYEEMKHRITTLCDALSRRSPMRGQKSSYQITYSETACVTLDRPTWMNWYVEQEQPRLRQNLTEYHQAGGRMPGTGGNHEVTVGMLTRDAVEGLQKSKEVSGNVGIEVGVFVITRSAQ